MIVMNVRLPKKMRLGLDIAAKREESTPTHVIRRAVAYYLRAFHSMDWNFADEVGEKEDQVWYEEQLKRP